MTLAVYIYLIGFVAKLEAVLVALMIISFILAALMGFLTLLGAEQGESWVKGSFSKMKIFTITCLVSTSIYSIVPSEKTMYMMAGGYAAQSVVESEIGDKVYTLINQELDKLITQEK